ncbi:MAG: hypothetical protein COW45_03370 [Gallionellales bacterium CG17_big_fil_post_rev_8_21_14_2_50_54_146]|nr:MAG: hypothetical protein COW45_03370 [Gallionellales bacterium CG17_big_fil_post_rev_8_21_14_2_50_54_146]
MSWSAALFATAIEAIGKDSTSGANALRSIVKSVIRFPIKTIAAFFMAPILVFKVAMVAKNPFRRLIAIVGLLLSVVLSWLAGTLLGSVAGFIFVGTHIGWLVAFGFFFVTTLSVILSVAFQIFVLT